MQIQIHSDGFDLLLDGRLILRHRSDAPCLFVGHGDARMDMYRGNFDIEDYVIERTPLSQRRGVARRRRVRDRFLRGAGHVAPYHPRGVGRRPRRGHLFQRARPVDQPGLAPRGRRTRTSMSGAAASRCPISTCAAAVSRSGPRSRASGATSRRRSPSRRMSTGKAGGDYWNTNYPQPTYLSSRRYALHVETTAYSAFDFRQRGFHEIEIWAVPDHIELTARPHFIGLVEALSERFGRQPPLPEWVYGGAIIGLKDGARSFERLETITAAGVKVSGLWCEDWVGLRQTSFGARLFWDWQANEYRYPGLAPAHRRRWRKGHPVPRLCQSVSGRRRPAVPRSGGGGLFRKERRRTTQRSWISANSIAASSTSPIRMRRMVRRARDRPQHDRFRAFRLDGRFRRVSADRRPSRQRSRCEIDAQRMADALGRSECARRRETRARPATSCSSCERASPACRNIARCCGAAISRWISRRHDGLVTVISGALSSGLLGNAYHHSDIGGYTSLFGNVRTAELMMRWAEMAAFTPVMRTHEGNRPRDNLQLDQDAGRAGAFRPHDAGLRASGAIFEVACGRGFAAAGLPVQRPLFLHFEDDRRHLRDPGCLSLRPGPSGGAGLAGGQDRVEHLSAGGIGLDPCLVRPNLCRRAGGDGRGPLRPAAGISSCRKPIRGAVRGLEEPLGMSLAELLGFLLLAGAAAYAQTLTGFAFGLITMGGVGLTGLLSLADAAMIVSMLVDGEFDADALEGLARCRHGENSGLLWQRAFRCFLSAIGCCRTRRHPCRSPAPDPWLRHYSLESPARAKTPASRKGSSDRLVPVLRRDCGV